MTFDGFIGQDAIKTDVLSRIQISATTGDLLPHLLFSGPSEMGKATFAHAVADQLGVTPQTFPASLSKKLDVIGIVSTIVPNSVAILEDIDNLKGDVEGVLEDILSKGAVDIEIGTGPGARMIAMDLPHFTFLATSSRPWQIPASLRRWFVALDFSDYSNKEIAGIVRTLALADGLDLHPAAATAIASQCAGIPGNARAILRRIRTHYGGLVTGRTVDEGLTRHVLAMLGCGQEESANVSLADRLRAMSGTQFEEFVAGLFRNLGYVTQLTPGSGDHGVDILIRKAGKRGAVQCKRWNDPVGEPVLRDFLGSMVSSGASVGFVVATTTFTDQARAFAYKHSIQLLDLDALLRMAEPDADIPPRQSLFN